MACRIELGHGWFFPGIYLFHPYRSRAVAAIGNSPSFRAFAVRRIPEWLEEISAS
jgi:hypothetical protein